jgi:hypothetical protein
VECNVQEVKLQRQNVEDLHQKLKAQRAEIKSLVINQNGIVTEKNPVILRELLQTLEALKLQTKHEHQTYDGQILELNSSIKMFNELREEEKRLKTQTAHLRIHQLQIEAKKIGVVKILGLEFKFLNYKKDKFLEKKPHNSTSSKLPKCLAERLPEDWRGDLEELRQQWLDQGYSGFKFHFLTVQSLSDICWGWMQIKIEDWKSGSNQMGVKTGENK